MLGQLFTVAGEELKYGYVFLKHQIGSTQQSKAKVLVNGSPKSGTTWMLKDDSFTSRAMRMWVIIMAICKNTILQSPATLFTGMMLTLLK